ncbi:YadA-like family protein [Fusobacterium necrophorum subsp. funduliforme]
MKRKLKSAVAMLALFSVVGVTGEAAGRPKQPLKTDLKAKDVAGKGKMPKKGSYALPSKVVEQLNKTNKRVNYNWTEIKNLKDSTEDLNEVLEAVQDLVFENANNIADSVERDKNIVKRLADKQLQLDANKVAIEKEIKMREMEDKKHDEAIAAESNRRALADTRLAYEIGGNRTNINKLTKEVEARKEVDERQDKAIAANSSAIKHLDRKVNKGTSMLVAMSNVDFQDVNAGEVAVGAGVGHYVGDQAVAVGVAYGVNDDLKIHAKWSGVAGDPHYNAIGGGVTYKFRTR